MKYPLTTSTVISSNVKQLISALCICFLVATMNANAAPESQDAKQNDAGLASIENTGFDTFLVADGFKLPASRKIYVSFEPVSFSEDWLGRFPNTNTYQKRISRDYGNGLKNKLQETLTDAGWQVVDTPGSDTVQLSVRLFNLFITAPDSPANQDTLVANVGSAAIELIFKTPDGQPVLKIVDKRITPNDRPVWAGRAVNYRYFKQLITLWSEGAVYFFDKILSIANNSKQEA